MKSKNIGVNMEKYVKPTFGAEAFNCPHCGVYSAMQWNGFYNRGGYSDKEVEGYSFFNSSCFHCNKQMIWYVKDEQARVFFPREVAIAPEKNMPDKVREIYEEASLVLGDSPRASCALLRLALQELMRYLKDNVEGYDGLKIENLNQDIKEVINIGNFHQAEKETIEEAMNSVRLIGNSAVHPSELDINDNPEIANILFEMINFIVGEIITKPKELQEKLNKIKKTIEISKDKK